MDACTYESITGLKTYYGFKSLIKNATRTGVFGCDDDTIIFNRVQTYRGGALSISLESNQVAVILNATTENAVLAPTAYTYDDIRVTTVYNQTCSFTPDMAVVGMCIVGTFTLGFKFGYAATLTLAIFDLV